MAAFDQSEAANSVYEYNFGRKPCARNLDTIGSAEIPEAELWWMSPPCKPFSRRGKRNDLDDNRAAAFKNMMALLPDKLPVYLALENVLGFENSQAEKLLIETLKSCNYTYEVLRLCPSMFGTPMKRPRLFYLAARQGVPGSKRAPAAMPRPLSDFLDSSSNSNPSLRLPEQMQQKYLDSLNIVDPADESARAICFTSGYGKCLKASGSYIILPDGGLRLFSPEELLMMLDFPERFKFPQDLSTLSQLNLAGNSIDRRSLKFALEALLP